MTEKREDVGGAKTAVEHLISLNHKKIGYIGGPEEIYTSIQRKQGYIKALEENNIKLNVEYMYSSQL